MSVLGGIYILSTLVIVLNRQFNQITWILVLVYHPNIIPDTN